MSELDFDIVIVGGGMVGAAMAADIAGRAECAHLRLAVIEAADAAGDPGDTDFDPRVVALSQRSQQMLERIGVWQSIHEHRACAYRAMNIWEAEGTGHIQFYADDVHLPQLGHIVENSVVVHYLQQHLQTLPAVTLLNGYRVKGWCYADGVSQLTISHAENDTQVNCTLVVAADGAHSKLRTLAQLPVREWDYGQSAIVTTVTTALPHQYTCWQRFTQQGPVALLPLQIGSVGRAEESHCALVWSANSELAEHLITLSDADFCKALERATESCLGRVQTVAERFALPLWQRHAVAYVTPGLALVGDAAHTIHPLAGQGVNLGFYDIEALAAEVERACQRSVPLSDAALLRRYQRARQSHNLSAMVSMEGFKRLFGADTPLLRWARNTGMTFVNNQLFLKKQLTKIASGL